MTTVFPGIAAHRRDLSVSDPAISGLIGREEARQEHNLELIASENIASLAVRQAMMSVLTDKYAEGYPGARYYGGCEVVDEVENLARDRAKELFGARYANVQPHSGSQANMAVYFTFLKPGDAVMGMDLSQGGHLTHGSKVNFSGQLYDFTPYGINPETELLDYDLVAETAKKVRPKMITVGASAYSREIDFKIFREIADSVGAFVFADIAHPAGLIAKGFAAESDPARPRRDDDYSQDVAGSAWWHDPPRSGLRESVWHCCSQERQDQDDVGTPRQHGDPRNPRRTSHARHRGQGSRVW